MQAPGPKKRLFKNAEQPKAKAPKRTAAEIATMRAQPNVFDVVLPGGDSDTLVTISMTRPVLGDDHLIVKDKDMGKALAVIADGLDVDQFLQKRLYQASGKQKLWKHGDKFVEVEKDEHGKYRRKHSANALRAGIDMIDDSSMQCKSESSGCTPCLAEEANVSHEEALVATGANPFADMASASESEGELVES